MKDKEMIEITEKAVRKNQDNSGALVDLLNQEQEELQKAMIEDMANCKLCYQELGRCGVKDRKYCSGWKQAVNQYERGCRKIDKDSVVLTREEWARLRNLEINYEDMYEHYLELSLEHNSLKDKVVLSKEEYEKLLVRPLNAMGDLVISKIKNKKCKYNKDDICVNADSEYLADYCPIQKDSVALTREEKNALWLEAWNKATEQARKETAREILKDFVDTFPKVKGISSSHAKIHRFIDELAKQFGVEIKE